MNTLSIYDLTVEHQTRPIGIDVARPRFGWKIKSTQKETMQSAFQICIFEDERTICDTGITSSDQSTEVEVPGFTAKPMTRYQISVTVWDQHGTQACQDTCFETGRMGIPFRTKWAEPEQDPTPDSMTGKVMSLETVVTDAMAGIKRDYAEFRPAQYLRIPVQIEKNVLRARIYATAHGVYQLEVNGLSPDRRELAPENSSYEKILFYQTYDVTELLRNGSNVIGVILGDGWWSGRVGMSGDSCQYGNKIGLLLEGVIEYTDGTEEIISGEQAVSATGPILFSDLFVGEKYDASKELDGWSCPGFDDSQWKPVKTVEYPMDNLTAQYAPPVRVIRTITPRAILTSPKGEMILDMGQVMAGCLEFTLDAEEGIEIQFEHTEVLDREGNYFKNIFGTNKDQTVFYRTKAGHQTYRPHFTYHGFRYVRITGWPGKASLNNFKGLVFSSDVPDIGSFETSDARINRLQKNIWWSQVANTISIPTDCPQREKAGWTGDLMVYAPTLCFNRNADAFLTSWMRILRKDQLPDGEVPFIVPYPKPYQLFSENSLGTNSCCGWGDAVINVPYSVYQAYGDQRILEENYEAMTAWMDYIRDQAEHHHPEGYDDWDSDRKERSRYLWNTGFHYGDWLIPSVIEANPDEAVSSVAMRTAYETMAYVAPAYYAFSAKKMTSIARILGREQDASYYSDLYEKIRSAFIEEYVHEDGTMDADFQGLYVIALENGLVTEAVRPKMTEHLCQMIRDHGGCLDTGFLSVPFLMDVLCENGKRDVAFSLLFQTACPSWLYEVEHGATTMWESWGAIDKQGNPSEYSYNHYAFGCIGEWLYREIGGLKALEPGYKKIQIAPALDCGLTYAKTTQQTPYGMVQVEWSQAEGHAMIKAEIPANTTAVIDIPGLYKEIGSGTYVFSCTKEP